MIRDLFSSNRHVLRLHGTARFVRQDYFSRLLVVFARQCRSGALEHVKDGECQDGGEIDPAKGRDDASEQVEVRVAKRRQGVRELPRWIREPRQDESTDDECVVNVQRGEDAARNDALHGAVPGDHCREKLPSESRVASQNLALARTDPARSTANAHDISVITQAPDRRRRTLSRGVSQLDERPSCASEDVIALGPIVRARGGQDAALERPGERHGDESAMFHSFASERARVCGRARARTRTGRGRGRWRNQNETIAFSVLTTSSPPSSSDHSSIARQDLQEAPDARATRRRRSRPRDVMAASTSAVRVRFAL